MQVMRCHNFLSNKRQVLILTLKVVQLYPYLHTGLEIMSWQDVSSKWPDIWNPEQTVVRSSFYFLHQAIICQFVLSFHFVQQWSSFIHILIYSIQTTTEACGCPGVFLPGLFCLSWLFAYIINHLKLQKSSHSIIQWTWQASPQCDGSCTKSIES